jgi:DNA modification methylase
MCGDSTSIENVEALCAGTPIDCCWTDPPYNVDYEGSAGKIANDNMEDSQFRQFLLDAFVSAFAVLREGAPIYVAHADTEGLNFRGAFKDAGLKLSGCLIWVKPSLVLGRSDYQWRHEPILYGWKPGAAHSWYGGRAKTTVIDAKDMPFRVMQDGSVQIEIGESTLNITGKNLEVEEVLGSTIRAEKPKKNADHPTMKPVELVLGMLKNSSRRGSTVLDLFGGSGSTLIACQKSGRKARLMEFDPQFVDVIIRRWQDFTGKSAVHEQSGKTFDDLQKQGIKT